MRERLHAVAGKQTLAEQDDGATHPVVGKTTLAASLGDGEALPHELQQKFGKSLGRDLADVRVHASPKAALLADKLNARAFTVGNNLIFGANQYNPHSDKGRSLIAHEVAHAAQQGFAHSAIEVAHGHGHESQLGPAVELVSGPTELTKASAMAEADADSAAGAMLAGLKALVTPQPIAIARKGNDEAIDEHPIDTKASTAGANNDETIGELTADRVGEEPLENGVPLVEKPDTLGEQQGLATGGAKAKGDVHAMPAGDDAPPRMDAGGEGAGGGGVEGGGGGAAAAGGVVGGELGAMVQEAQREAREGAAAAEGEASAFKAEMKAKQDKFDAEQQATVLESLKKMSPKDKRSTLADLGYDPKALKKLKDSELDDVISGKLEAENRKGKILGMEPEELAKLSSGQKLQFLCDLGIDRKDLEKAGPAKCDKLFADIIKASKIPGQQKVKVKIKGGLFGKSWVVTIKVDDAGVDISAKKEGGFLSKLVGWVKAALPVILTVLAPITGGISLIALSVYQTIVAIKTGDWLGAIVGAAGAFAGLGALKMIKNGVSGIATAFQKIGQIANKVKVAAGAAQAAMIAAKAKNPGSLLAALASGAATFATFASNAAGKFATTMNTWAERLKKWSAIAAGGQKVVQGIKNGDPLAALAGGFETAGAIAGGKTAKDLQRASTITTYVNTGRRALQANPPDYAAVADAALGIAGQLHQDRRIDDAQRIVQRANALRVAFGSRDPAAIAQAAMALAEGIQLAKYDLEHDEKDADKDGKPDADKDRDAIVARYQRNTRIVSSAANALEAVTSRPPNYTAALAAFTSLTAELTEDKRIDAASELTTKMDKWTQAVRSGDERAILEAGIAFGESINGMRSSIEEHRNEAKKEAEKSLPPGETLPPGEVDTLPVGPNRAELLKDVPDIEKEKEKDPIQIDKLTELVYSRDVEIAQGLLNRRGFSLKVDGFLGEATRTALREFQRSAKPPLRATGILDSATFDRLVATGDGGTTDIEDEARKSELARLQAELARVQLDGRLVAAQANDMSRNMRRSTGAMTSHWLDKMDPEILRLERALDDSTLAKTVERYRHYIGLIRADISGVKYLMEQIFKVAEINARQGEVMAGGLDKVLWASDATFEAFAHRAPVLAAIYGFLRHGLPIAINEGDLSKALVHGLGGAGAMLIEGKVNAGRLSEVIAKETAKSLFEQGPQLVDELGQIRSTSLSDFARQAEPKVAAFCKRVSGSILSEIVTSYLPKAAEVKTVKERDELEAEFVKQHLHELLAKLAENGLQEGLKALMAEVYERLEKALANP